MIGTREVSMSIAGAFRLARGDAGGMTYFNRTIDGFWNSFFAAVIVAPGYVALTLIGADQTAVDHPTRVVVVDFIAYVIGWIAFPLAMVSVAEFLDREKRYIDYIVALNWAAVPQVLLFLMAAVVAEGLGSAPALVHLVGILVTAAVALYYWFIARIALDVTPLQAAALVGLDVVITIVIGGISEGLKSGAI